VPRKTQKFDDPASLSDAVEKECHRILAEFRGVPVTDEWLRYVRDLLAKDETVRDAQAENRRLALRSLAELRSVVDAMDVWPDPECIDGTPFEWFEWFLAGAWIPDTPTRGTIRRRMTELSASLFGHDARPWINEFAALRLLIERIPPMKPGEQLLSVREVLERESRQFRPLCPRVRPKQLSVAERDRARRLADAGIEIIDGSDPSRSPPKRRRRGS